MSFSIFTQLVVDAAERRGIGVSTLPGMSRDYAMLEYRGHTEFVLQGMSDRVGTVTMKVLYNKAAAMHLLAKKGFPVPRTLLSNGPAPARAFLNEVRRVVVKPMDATGGVGVTVDVTTYDQLVDAIAGAKASSTDPEGRVIVQEQVPGVDYRVLVIGERCFAIERLPPSVIGDGTSTIQQLVTTWNQTVKLGHQVIVLTEDHGAFLARQGYTLQTVPARDSQVDLDDVANAHRGGFTHDVTELMADEVVALARKVCATFKVPYLGIDLISDDISTRPGKIIELNPHAGLAMHHHPTSGTPRDPAGALIDLLFPETARSWY